MRKLPIPHMAKKTLIRRSLAASAGAVAAAALLGAGAAQAAPAPTAAPQGAATASSTAFRLPANTWVFMPVNLLGNTKICAKNVGSNTGKLKVESTAFGLGKEYISTIAPSQTKCISRAWLGVPVKLTNVSNTTLIVTGS